MSYILKQIEEEKRLLDLQKLEFEKSLELRTFEIDNFWKRGWFFGALILAVAGGYFELHKDQNNSKCCIYMAFLGLLISFFQGLMNRGSKYWQERWENKTKHLESVLGINVTKSDGQYEHNKTREKYYLDASTLAKNENIFTRANRYSVSKLTILVWDIITLFWLILWITDCNFSRDADLDTSAFWIHFVIISYILVFFFFKKIKRNYKERIKLFVYLWKHKKRSKAIFYLVFPFILKDGGGGKVYDSFTIEKNKNTHRKNSDKRFYRDSENYIKNFGKKPKL